jgi:hypothetical protein
MVGNFFTSSEHGITILFSVLALKKVKYAHYAFWL